MSSVTAKPGCTLEKNPMTTMHPEIQKTFTDRSNARRAALRLLQKGVALASAFDIVPHEGRFEIHWLNAAQQQDAEREAEFAALVATVHEPAAETEIVAATMTPNQALDNICGEGTAAHLKALDALLDVSGEQQTAADSVIKARRARKLAAQSDALAAKGPRATFAAPVEAGVIPEKPVLTTAGFTASYQKRIEKLAELAAAGDWNAVAAYEVKGHNTYSKIVARYRDQLVAFHAYQCGR
jgi:hypothetical protein